jgi:hypothetical protein
VTVSVSDPVASSGERRKRAQRGQRTKARAIAAPPRNPWLVGPAFDLVFLANATWPLVVLLTVITVRHAPQGGFTTHPGLTFWQIYFLTTPHRWITLALVFLDGDRFRQRPRAFVGVALTFLLLIAAIWLSTQTLALFLLVDYLWNAWHYASQHSGISRIYGRAARPGVQTSGRFEKIVLRVFVLYSIFRLPLWAVPSFNRTSENVDVWPAWIQSIVVAFYEGVVALAQAAQNLDLLMLVLPVLLIANELRDVSRSSIGRLTYLGSVCLLYTSLLMGVHWQIDNRALLGIFLAVSMFHATEYLAIVSWSVWKKHGRTPATLLGHLVPRWGMAIITFMAVLSMTAWVMDRNYFRVWLVVTIFVSYLHYAYDGMIWKVRRPTSAAVA